MSLLEVNKILASILIGLIVIVIISFIGSFFFSDKANEEAKNAYYIDTSEIETSVSTSSSDVKLVEPISLLLASASSEKGQKLYKKCSACHTYEKDGASKVGPNLWNLLNRPKASINNFAYSKALAEFGGTWGYEELNQFLYKPKDYLEGTKMNFSGLKKSEDRANLILYLREQADNPAPLP
ncbi:MAG: cytochrome c family protein [Rickettsiales bacterium]|nr:cytochrome c family protein [Rickettsiales bacterium]|tara:strand:- start:7872 stop:8417 length:546 start_codon:yes stop_codon:yes gene_type:complete